MLDRCITLLTPAIERNSNPIVIDATLGLGGHSKAILEKFPQVKIVGLDRDQSAMKIAKENLQEFAERITIIHAVYDELPSVLDSLGFKKVDGILFDLGVSSLQLDEAERGFSYSHLAPLDMRMDQSDPLSAAVVLNTYTKGELVRVLRNYGEEKFASRIADNIIKARASGLLNNTKDLAELVKSSIPAATRRTGGNPAKRTFQALRIEVNNELKVLETAIPAALDRLSVGGRMVVMSFQSLEDRIVKRFFADASESKSPRGLPVEMAEFAAKYNLVFRGSESASDEEIESNPRAQSVKLRAIERIAA